jgi:hypothetical protein
LNEVASGFDARAVANGADEGGGVDVGLRLVGGRGTSSFSGPHNHCSPTCLADYGTIYSLKDVFSRKKGEKQPKTGKKRGKTPIFELKIGGGEGRVSTFLITLKMNEFHF